VLQTYFLICCAAADVPSTRFMSREPAGQTSTGESDLRNYYDRLSSDQKVRLSPALTRLDEVFKRSILGPINEDDGIDYIWNSLWVESDQVNRRSSGRCQ
jgi:hypothetical protein